MSSSELAQTLRVRYESTEKLQRKKVIKVVKKLRGEEKDKFNDSIQKDFALENGDARSFLYADNQKPESLGIRTYGLTHKKSDSNTSRLMDMSAKNSTIEARIEAQRRRVTIRYAFAQQFMHRGMQFVDYEKHVRGTVHDIKTRIEGNKEESKSRIKKLSPDQKIEYLRQNNSLKKFRAAERDWLKLDSGLSRRANKSSKDLLSHKSYRTEKSEDKKGFNWSNMLRLDKAQKQVEVFQPVGSKLSGIYLRDVVKLKTAYKKSNSEVQLKLQGASKLPLEIEAITKPGTILNKKTEPDEKIPEEVIAASYDFSRRFLRDIIY